MPYSRTMMPTRNTTDTRFDILPKSRKNNVVAPLNIYIF